jgi:hypothetical protein
LAPSRCVDRNDHARVVVGLLIQALVWTVPVEVVLVLTQHAAGVMLVIDQDPVGALCPNATNEPLGNRVRPRRTAEGLDHVDAVGGEHSRATSWRSTNSSAAITESPRVSRGNQLNIRIAVRYSRRTAMRTILLDSHETPAHTVYQRFWHGTGRNADQV